MARPHIAKACGGCFHQPIERQSTVVTDHRMAFSVSPEQTVLWDQIRYSGDPREFAWVLPVHPGARVELSHDAWFAALDASTQPVITSPGASFGGGGCANAGCSSSGSSSADTAGGGGGGVQIVSQTVVGPYETVTLRSTDPNALETWLTSHAYDIPSSIQPTIAAYVSEGFDFIALRLRPVCSERAMQPVRIVTPGADASLPLRMIAAGVGATVGITLYVISEGRFHPQNFPDATIDYSRLLWDSATNRSNYEELSQEAMKANSGRSWLTEYADHPQTSSLGFTGGGFSGNPGLADAYVGLCSGRSQPGGGSGGGPSPCVPTQTGFEDAGSDAGPAKDAAADAAAEASDDASPTGDAAADAVADASSDGSADASGDGASNASGDGSADTGATPPDNTFDAGGPSPTPTACQGFDDLDVALRGMHPNDVWVTRLRAVLPRDALSIGDLRLEPTPKQEPVSNFHQSVGFTNGAQGSSASSQNSAACASAPNRSPSFAGWLLLGLTWLGVAGILRRRSR